MNAQLTLQLLSIIFCARTKSPSRVLHSLNTFTLDLEHADGVLRVQVPELAGRERVSSPPQLADSPDGRLQEEGLEERRAVAGGMRHVIAPPPETVDIPASASAPMVIAFRIDPSAAGLQA